MSTKDKTITIFTYHPYEMAFIDIDENNVFTGNYWDFKIDTHSSKIAGYELEGKWESGYKTLARAIKVEMEKEGFIATIVEKTLSKTECESRC